MDKQFTQTKAFHTKFRSLWQDTPGVVDEETRNVRIRLMREELEEAIEAMEREDIADIAKELADVLYTVYGTIGAYGLAGKMEAIFDEVHSSNMSKDMPDIPEGSMTKTAKAIKGSAYRKADIAKVINA